MNPKKVLLPGRGREERESKRTDEPYKEQCTKRDELKKKKKGHRFQVMHSAKRWKSYIKNALAMYLSKRKGGKK